MIYRTILDKTEGSTTSEEVTVTYTYQIIADKYDTAGAILSLINGSTIAVPDILPRNGDILEGAYTVNSTNLSWAEDRNFKDIDGSGKKVWTYEVTAIKDSTLPSTTDDEFGVATDLSLTPVYYNEFTELSYKSGAVSRDEKGLLVNAVGDKIGRTIKVWNMLLSFTYYVKTFHAVWARDYLNSINAKPIQIAGIDISTAKRAKIVELTPTLQTVVDSGTNKKTERYQVRVGIEIQTGKHVQGDVLIGNGFNALFNGVKRKIQRWTAAEVFVNGKSLVVTPDAAGIANVKAYFNALNASNKESGIAILYSPEFVVDNSGKWHNFLGYFGGAISATEGQWEDIQEPVVLNADGTVCTKNVMLITDPDLNIIYALDCLSKDWKTLGLPQRGFLM